MDTKDERDTLIMVLEEYTRGNSEPLYDWAVEKAPKALDEIDRLNEEKRIIRNDCDGMMHAIDQQAEEIEQLKIYLNQYSQRIKK